MSAPYWTDGQITLWHGDCREVTGWLAADVLVTDPPYGRALEIGGRGTRPIRGQQIAGDKDTSTRDAALALWGIRAAILFGDPMLCPPQGTKQVLIYGKSCVSGALGTFAGFRRDIEAIYLVGSWQAGHGGRSAILATGARNTYATAGRYGHPHAKPVDVMEMLIAACPPGTIADPFAGSGSTLVAARNQGHRAIGVEVHEPYCEMAARRLSQGDLFGEAS